MSWIFLIRLLDEISNHSSTFINKIWLTFLIIFRIVLTVVGGESIFYDDESQFGCNIIYPGCSTACYDAFSPLAQSRFWFFQMIMISAPIILYLGYAMYKIAQMEDDDYGPRVKKRMVSHSANRGHEEADDNREEDPMILEEIVTEKKEKPNKKHDGRRRIMREGLMKAYVFQLLVRAVFEASFLYVQYILYGFEVMLLYECTRWPCRTTVQCFVSRPTEKTLFLRIMYAVSALCLLFTVLEILFLGIGGFWDCFCRLKAQPPTPRHSALASQRSFSLSSTSICRQPFGDEASSWELVRHRRHLKLAQQHPDMANQNEESNLSCSSSPESNGTTVEQNRLNFAQEKQKQSGVRGVSADRCLKTRV